MSLSIEVDDVVLLDSEGRCEKFLVDEEEEISWRLLRSSCSFSTKMYFNSLRRRESYRVVDAVAVGSLRRPIAAGAAVTV